MPFSPTFRTLAIQGSRYLIASRAVASPLGRLLTSVVQSRLLTISPTFRHCATMEPEPVAVTNAVKEEKLDNTTSLSDCDEDDEEGIIENWHEVIEAIEKSTEKAFATSPSFDSSAPSAFQNYWRGVFSRLRDSISADLQVPQYVTKPPVEKFTVTLFDEMEFRRCPCCHPEVEPNIVLENKGGITKEHLINGIMDHIYNDTLPRVYTEPVSLHGKDIKDQELEDGAFKDNMGVIVYASSWISSGSSAGGETIAYGTEPNIILYCCRQDEYMKQRGDIKA